MKKRVFLPIANDRYDTSLAKEYGDIYVLHDGHLNPFNTNECICLLKNALIERDFDPKKDYLCMTGQSLVLSLCLAVVTSVHKRVNILLFDATTNMYRCRVVDLSGLSDGGEDDVEL